MSFGSRIYYDKTNGALILRTPQMTNPEAVDMGVDFDFQIYQILAERARETVSVLELEVDQYAQDFAEGILMGVDIKTNTLLFSYSEPLREGGLA